MGGPRIKNAQKQRDNRPNELYRTYFRKKYKDKQAKNASPNSGGLKKKKTREKSTGNTNELVDIYWDKYYKAKKLGNIPENLRRKNKKLQEPVVKIEELLTFNIGAYDFDVYENLEDNNIQYDKKYTLLQQGDKLLLRSGKTFEVVSARDASYSSLPEDVQYQIEFLQELGILTAATPIKFVEKHRDIKKYKMPFGYVDRRTVKLNLILDISTGKLYDAEDETVEKFSSFMEFWQEVEEFNAENMEIKTKKIEMIKEEKFSGGGINNYLANNNVLMTLSSGYLSSSSDDYSIYDED